MTDSAAVFKKTLSLFCFAPGLHLYLFNNSTTKMLYLVAPSAPSNSNFCLCGVETVFIMAGAMQSHSINTRMFMEKTRGESTGRAHASLPKHSSRIHDFHVIGGEKW